MSQVINMDRGIEIWSDEDGCEKATSKTETSQAPGKCRIIRL
jgi:hypothetical protein